MFSSYWPFFIALIIVLVVIPLVNPLALRFGLVDKPGGRKQHDLPVPHVGGLVIFPVYILVGLLAGFDLAVYWPLYTGIALLLLIGTVDDYYSISPWAKFGAQFTAAILIVVFGDAELHHLGNVFGFGKMGLGPFSIPFSVIAVVLLINAVNLMDGLDGLAAGQGLAVFFWLMIAAYGAGESGSFMNMLVFSGVLGGFLFYNLRHPFRKKASIFLGDAGSMALGLIVGWFAIHLAAEPAPALPPMAVAWILAVPIMDTCAQFNRRVREGRHPFSPDRGHFHHHFIRAGLSVRQATFIILTIIFALGGFGYLGALLGVDEWVLSAIWIVLILSHIYVSLNPDKYVFALQKLMKKD